MVAELVDKWASSAGDIALPLMDGCASARAFREQPVRLNSRHAIFSNDRDWPLERGFCHRQIGRVGPSEPVRASRRAEDSAPYLHGIWATRPYFGCCNYNSTLCSALVFNEC